MRIKLLGKYWNLVRTGKIPPGKWGDCDDPTETGKTIRVHSKLKGKLELEILLHEILHAVDWSKDEDWVENTAHDIAAVFWKLGYRRKGEL